MMANPDFLGISQSLGFKPGFNSVISGLEELYVKLGVMLAMGFSSVLKSTYPGKTCMGSESEN